MVNLEMENDTKEPALGLNKKMKQTYKEHKIVVRKARNTFLGAKKNEMFFGVERLF